MVKPYYYNYNRSFMVFGNRSKPQFMTFQSINKKNDVLSSAIITDQPFHILFDKNHNFLTPESESNLHSPIPDEQLDDFLREIQYDMELFYSNLTRDMKNKGGLLQTNEADAHKTFDRIRNFLKMISGEDFSGIDAPNKVPRDIQGVIAQNLIRRIKPETPPRAWGRLKITFAPFLTI